MRLCIALAAISLTACGGGTSSAPPIGNAPSSVRLIPVSINTADDLERFMTSDDPITQRVVTGWSCETNTGKRGFWFGEDSGKEYVFVTGLDPLYVPQGINPLAEIIDANLTATSATEVMIGDESLTVNGTSQWEDDGRYYRHFTTTNDWDCVTDCAAFSGDCSYSEEF